MDELDIFLSKFRLVYSLALNQFLKHFILVFVADEEADHVFGDAILLLLIVDHDLALLVGIFVADTVEAEVQVLPKMRLRLCLLQLLTHPITWAHLLVSSRTCNL